MTMAKLGGVKHAPMNKARLSCLILFKRETFKDKATKLNDVQESDQVNSPFL